MTNLNRPTPHICYCQIPPDKLKELARQRFVQGIGTEDLMKRCKDHKEKEYLAAVALLDVRVENIPRLVPEAEQAVLQHLIDCRYHVQMILEEAGIKVEEKF